MPDFEERIASVEGRVQEHASYMNDLRATGAEVREEIRGVRQELRQSIGDLRAEMREDMRNLRDEMNRRFEHVDRRFDTMERRFGWLVGMMVTGFLAVIGTVAGAFWSLLQTVR